MAHPAFANPSKGESAKERRAHFAGSLSSHYVKPRHARSALWGRNNANAVFEVGKGKLLAFGFHFKGTKPKDSSLENDEIDEGEQAGKR